ncbi:hypothetical protein ES703_99242 [subsurface metagenome]
MVILYSYNMEKHSKEATHIHKLTIAELLGVIDHRVRGIQQLIIALRDLSSNGSLVSSLDQVMKGMKELQEIYQGFLNARRVEEETLKIDYGIKEGYRATKKKIKEIRKLGGPLRFMRKKRTS